MTGTDDRDPRIADLLERHTAPQAGTPDWARLTARRRRRRAVRPVIVGLASLAVAALVGVMFLLAPRGARPPADPAAHLFYGGRTESGIALHLSVSRFPGTGWSPAAAASHAAEAIKDAANRDGYPVLVSPRPDGTLDLWVPTARTAEDVAALTTWSAAAYDIGRPIARSRRAADVFRAAERLGPRGTGSALYLTDPQARTVVGPAEDIDTLNENFLVSSWREFDPSGLGDGFTLHHVPSGYVVVRNARREYLLIRDRPLVRPQDVLGLVGPAGAATLRLTDEGRRRWEAVGAGAGEPVVILWQWEAPEDVTGIVAGTIVDRPGSGPSVASPSAVLRDLGRSPTTRTPGALRVIDAEPTGTPRRAGAAEPPPPAIEGALESFQVKRDTLRKVLTAGRDGRRWSLWTGMTATEGDVAFIDDGGPTLAEFRWCSPEPGDAAAPCFGDAERYSFGRINVPGARIDAPDVVMDNGWYFIPHPPGPSYPVRDAAGRRIGTIDTGF